MTKMNQTTPEEAQSADINQLPDYLDGEDASEVEPKQHPTDILRSFIGKSNLVDMLEAEDVQRIGMEITRGYDVDKASRAEWEKQTKIAMDLAMQVTSEKTWPWLKAANVKYPLITTAAIQFSARAYPSIVAGSEVVKGMVTGPDPDGRKKERADRIGHHMSYQVLEEIEDWDEEEDKLLLQLSIVGCTFRKTYFDTMIGRPCSDLVSANDLVYDHAVPWKKLRRKTHCINLYKNDVIERIRGGIFTEIELGLPDGSDNDEDGHFIFLECHCWYDIDEDGYKEPYIVTVKKDTSEVVRIIARFDEEGIFLNNKREVTKILPVEYFTKFAFMPNPDGGSYDVGLGMLLNPINETVNTVLNQLLDSATLANTGGGFLGSGLKMKGGAVRFTPGEFKPVDVSGGRISDNIFHMQFPGPNAVMFQLLGMLIDAGKDISSVKDILTGEQQVNQTATTTLALIEQGQKVFSAIYKRVHRSLKEEFKKLYRLNKLYLIPEDYYRFQDKVETIYLDDYQGDETDVCPVSDPSLVSDAQILTRAEALMKFVGDPLFDQLALRKNYLKAIKVQDSESLLIKDADKQLQQQLQQLQQQAQQMHEQMQQMGQKLQQAESGQAKAQAEVQNKLKMAQIDAQIEDMRHQREIEFKKQQAELDAHIEMLKTRGTDGDAQQKSVADAQMKREQLAIESHVSLDKAKQDAAIKLEIAKLDNETKEDIAELNAYVELEKARIAPPPGIG